MRIQDKARLQYQEPTGRDTFQNVVWRLRCVDKTVSHWKQLSDYLHFLSDLVPFVKVFIHSLSYLRSTTKPKKGEDDTLRSPPVSVTPGHPGPIENCYVMMSNSSGLLLVIKFCIGNGSQYPKQIINGLKQLSECHIRSVSWRLDL